MTLEYDSNSSSNSNILETIFDTQTPCVKKYI